MSPDEEFPFALAALAQPVVGELAKQYAQVVADLQRFDPVLTAASFGALLALPELQSNCHRIEALVHLAAQYCQGRMAPGVGLIARCFERLGQGPCGLAEDPAEDVFVSLVNTPRGNFRIFEGIREGAGFYLQRVLEAVQQLPERCCVSGLLERVDCLLKLSEALAERLGILQNSLGEELPRGTMPNEIAAKGRFAASCIRFSQRDLERLQISPAALADLTFEPKGTDLTACTIGHTELERRPLASRDNCVYLLLPTAVATTITRLVIESVSSTGTRGVLEALLAREYRDLFRETPILPGSARVDMVFQKIAGGCCFVRYGAS